MGLSDCSDETDAQMRGQPQGGGPAPCYELDRMIRIGANCEESSAIYRAQPANCGAHPPAEALSHNWRTPTP